MRRLVTLHTMLSFFFNTMVLALTVNLAASLVLFCLFSASPPCCEAPAVSDLEGKS
jgi:hypothetical protein